MLLERVVALDERLQAEPSRRVPDLRPAQDPEASVDVLARDGGLDLLDAHEVLLVERTQPIQAIFELIESAVDLLRLHGGYISAYGHRSSHRMLVLKSRPTQ
jgi:outer membrane protein TolC